MDRNRLLNLTLLVVAGLAAVSLAVSASRSDWATASQPAERLTIPTPTPTLVPSSYAPVVVKNYPSLSQAAATTFPNCRYGVAAWQNQMQNFDIVSNLGVGWYLDFTTHETPPGPAQAEYVHMVRLSQDRGESDTCGPDYGYSVSPPLTDAGLGALVDANPGALWIVGNEPDRRTVQDDICPQQYAEAYHDVYQFIKSRDPTAQVAVAGLVEVSPGRLQYLDIVWETYLEKYGTPMPVDVWTIHVYILSESNEGDAHIALGTDPALAIPHSSDCADPNSYCYAEHDDVNLFAEQIVRMREWMKRRGQQNKPLLITEYGILLPYNYYGTCTLETCPPEGAPGCFCDENKETFHPRRVADYMTATFDYLMTATDPDLGYPADNYRLVQQWLWFSLAYDREGHASNLMDSDTYTLTLPGWTWRNYVAAISPTINLIPAQVPVIVARSANGTDPVTVTLTAEVRNNGNATSAGTVTVTFYSDAGLTTPIGSATFTDLGGCARRAAVVTTTWANLETGLHPFWVRVDSTDVINENGEADNVAQGAVMVNPFDLFLPVLLR